MKGRLPWQDMKAADRQEKYELIGNLKLTTPIPVLCKDLPNEFCTYLSYVKGLDFIEKPDYKYLKGLFRTLFLNSGFEFDYAYDWLTSKQKEDLKYINKNARDYSKGQKTISTTSNNDINEGPVLQNKGVGEAPYTKRYRGSIVSLAKELKEPEVSTYRFLINGETPSAQHVTKSKWESTKILEVETPFNRNNNKNSDLRRTSMEITEDKLGKNLLFSDYSNKMSSITSAITSDHSSKVPNISRSKYEEEDEIPFELKINASPSIVIQTTKPLQMKTKDSYYSSQVLDTLLPHPDTSRSDLRKRTFSKNQIPDFDDERSPKIKGTMRTRFASGHEKITFNQYEENLNESSICEKVVASKKNINLTNRRFSARGDKIF